MFWAYFQIILVFGIMGFGVYFFVKKLKVNQFNKIGDKGKIRILDGVNISYQTSTYLLDVDGQPVFVVVGPNGIDTTLLKEKRFEEILNNGLEGMFEEENDVNLGEYNYE